MLRKIIDFVKKIFNKKVFAPTDTVKFSKTHNVKMIAHRGLSGLETENTKAAFVAACNHDYFGVESDVHITSDGKFVVIHDDDTSRVAHTTVNVEESTYADLRNIILKDMHSQNLYDKSDDLRIPSLDEFISICQKYGKHCVLELKNKFSYTDIVHLTDEVKKLGYENNITYISFILENLVALRSILPKAKLQYITKKFNRKILSVLDSYNLDLDIKYKALNARIVNSVHSAGHKVNCWTCDDPKMGTELADLGVDFITTNILE